MLPDIEWELHQEPDKEVRKRWDFLEGLLKKGKKAQHKKLLQHFFKTDPWFLARYGFGYGFLDEELHSKVLLQWNYDHWHKDRMLLFSRGFGKTVMTNVIATAAVLADPNLAMMFVTDENEKANDFCASLASNWMSLPGLQYAYDHIFPSSSSEAHKWSNKGYFVHRTGAQRREPTLLPHSVRMTPTGWHPGLVLIDDPVGLSSNNEAGWTRANRYLREAKNLTQSNGVISVTGTFWHERCPYTDIIKQRILGGRGAYECLVMTCYKDFARRQGVWYERKERGGFPCKWFPGNERMIVCGESRDTLIEMEENPDTAMDFACQMANNPHQGNLQAIDINNLQYLDKRLDELPLGRIQSIAIESGAGSSLIFGEIRKNPRYKGLPVVEHKVKKGIDKIDRINAIVEPYINRRKVMLLKDVPIGSSSEENSLWYQLNGLGYTRHDDFADAFSIALDNKGVKGTADPRSWRVYIGVDVAYSATQRSDFTAMVAVAADFEGNAYIVGLDQFKSDVPTDICDRIYEFYNQINELCRHRYSSDNAPYRRRLSSYRRR